jgi:hypothetical protein
VRSVIRFTFKLPVFHALFTWLTLAKEEKKEKKGKEKLLKHRLPHHSDNLFVG